MSTLTLSAVKRAESAIYTCTWKCPLPAMHAVARDYVYACLLTAVIQTRSRFTVIYCNDNTMHFMKMICPYLELVQSS